ncbi:MAG: AAA family ATPase, partial [Pseudonocardia sp.]|nr:AAA family ATPase [Pseudonocardia sp.]
MVRDGHGYRIGLPRDEVDTLRLDDLTDRARRALSSGDAMAARDAAVEAAALTGSLAAPDGAAAGPLAELRRAAAARATDADGLLGRALAETGDHAAALPRLEATSHRLPSDETVLACLLRSEAAVRGAAAALDRYERYRGELRDRLGTDPGEPLQRVHRDLLALDSPVRDGVRYDATALLGRADDVRRLSALLNSARVVSIVGPGGLGKTRLAHVLGRNSGRSVVHFLELVGVTAPEDLLGELGSALGVRDSVSGRRSLTPAQRSDIRARIAQHLDRAPSLLILDNCEHIIEAVADLVAFLVATTRELRVLTTTRAPLAIAAERVYQLAQLGTVDAAELFAQRAVAARPDVVLEEPAVRDIVRRLDGLPLAIELAAAKVRAMSVDDIGRRLENRFALLRGGDRSAPDRHQTLLAVIDWSWNLLAEPERRALRRLSVFHDGFSLDAAEAVLGGDALAAVQSLADQSLVSVTESGSGAGVRYRMLETVREFGRMQLVDAGEDGDAHRAQRAWATAFARSHGSRLFGTDQFAAIDALGAEESNLADVLRQALAQPDPAAVVELLGGLGGFWSVRGDHIRVIVLAEAIVAAVAGWCPPRELEDLTRLALVSVLSNTMIVVDDR